ncbi:hypothetical protein [Roseburia faecis]|uniref:hypothetical protein n=1 Tax=Roseburia faecis TaxID=301302 RepID=UPI00386E6306
MIRDYLRGYKGTLITDGYHPYHTLAKHSDDIEVAAAGHMRDGSSQYSSNPSEKEPH